MERRDEEEEITIRNAPVAYLKSVEKVPAVIGDREIAIPPEKDKGEAEENRKRGGQRAGALHPAFSFLAIKAFSSPMFFMPIASPAVKRTLNSLSNATMRLM